MLAFFCFLHHEPYRIGAMSGAPSRSGSIGVPHGNARILIIGATGFFGRHLAELLLQALARRRLGPSITPPPTLWLAARNAAVADAFANALRAQHHAQSVAEIRALSLDTLAPDFAARLTALAPHVVIHAAGPFQRQDYRVAQAAIAAGSHYIDLADARDFVLGIRALDSAAKERGVLVASGASSVPALSDAAINSLADAFSRVDAIDIGIAPGNRTERGEATVRAILSYVGQPFTWWEGARPQRVFGWQSLARRSYPMPVGRRWLAACDVPDLALLHERFPDARTIVFRAGLELAPLHLGLWLLSWIARARLVGSLDAWTRPLMAIANAVKSFGSDTGAMHVTLEGMDPHGNALTRTWYLTARDGHGPYVPAAPAAALAVKLLDTHALEPGARPCAGMLTLDEILDALQGLAIDTQHATRATHATGSSHPS